MTYAENTSVPVERSRAEIEGLLTKYGSEDFMSGVVGTRAIIQFKMNARLVRFVLPLPDRKDPKFTKLNEGKWNERPRADAQALALYQQEERRRWRCLLLMVKAKLEACATHIVTFEDEFLAHFVMPDGKTFGEFVGPQLERAYASGKMPVLALPGGSA